MDVTYFLLLSYLGLAIIAQAQECSRPVAGPNMDLKDKDILLQTFPSGTTVSFACNVGYEPAGGSAFITCTAGTWSPVRLKCQRKNCGSAGEVENGHIDYPSGTEYGDESVVSCNTGYTLVGNSKLRCEAQGWVGRLPVCEVVTCDPPPMVANGAFSPDKEIYEYREVVRYTCQNDFTLNGSVSIACSEDGTFVPGPPKCTMLQCEDPNIENADWVRGSRPPHRYKATVTFRCRSGYVMTGADTQTCAINGQWSPGLPTCKRIITTTIATTTTTTHSHSTKKPTESQCEDPNIENADWVRGSRPPYRYKDTVTFQCRSGYVMTGADTQTCAINGQWSPGLPTCKPSIVPTVPPDNKGNNVGTTLGIVFGALGGAILTRSMQKMERQ
ncbi:C4b-binding protein alpha chain-like isoform X3 [Siniperca chuatsi]|uniref:C4b-binding protein alpha chain-like isoform X3 n=1 Tax=Siniperca chuatsi TaxID=119488 RepID=UPI001CE1D427|nr:C4b-binding protein alpha chain-like isoform X3 [Siniperca chuatsi]